MSRKYFYNENYFSKIDNEEKAYWAGFFYADGHVSNNVLTCSLKIDDKSHLEKFLKAIEANTVKISEIFSAELKCIKACRIDLCSITLCDDLRKLGFTNHKTYDNNDYVFQCVPDNLKKDFIRGFWDGDGCVQLREGRFGAISVISLNQQLLQSFCNYFSKIFNEENFAKVILTEEKYYRIVLGSEKAKKVCNLFYKDSTIYLERKYQNYLKFKTYNHNYKGIRQRKSGRYQVYMKIDYRQQSFGTYATLKEAVEAYNEAALKYGREPQEYFGESLIRDTDRIV